MKLPTLIAAAAVLPGASPPAPMTDRDFDQLMVAAVLAGASTAQSDTNVICVQRELELPLAQTKAFQQTLRQQAKDPSGMVPMNWKPRGLPTEALKAFERALTPNARIVPQQEIARLPSRFVLFSKGAEPKECDHRLPPPGELPNAKTPFVLSFNRPVLADGYAFVDEAGVCPGLCGTGWLGVFKKRNGKWQQVASAFLWIS